MECAAPAPATAQLAAAVMELLGAPGVHAHPQPFVRRSVLVAASQAGPPPLAPLLVNAVSTGQVIRAPRVSLCWAVRGAPQPSVRISALLAVPWACSRPPSLTHQAPPGP